MPADHELLSDVSEVMVVPWPLGHLRTSVSFGAHLIDLARTGVALGPFRSVCPPSGGGDAY